MHKASKYMHKKAIVNILAVIIVSAGCKSQDSVSMEKYVEDLSEHQTELESVLLKLKRANEKIVEMNGKLLKMKKELDLLTKNHYDASTHRTKMVNVILENQKKINKQSERLDEVLGNRQSTVCKICKGTRFAYGSVCYTCRCKRCQGSGTIIDNSSQNVLPVLGLPSMVTCDACKGKGYH